MCRKVISLNGLRIIKRQEMFAYVEDPDFFYAELCVCMRERYEVGASVERSLGVLKGPVRGNFEFRGPREPISLTLGV